MPLAPSRRTGTAAAGAASALVAAALFLGGGSGSGRLFWIATGALIAASALVVGTLLAVVPRPRLDGAAALFLVLFALLVLWFGLSVLWSVEPDRSWDYFNRALAYLALLIVGVFAGALVPRAPRVAAVVLAVLLGAVLLWALAGKVFPALYDDYGRRARLRAPVGYWNALALLGAMAMPLALWVLARARARARLAGVLLVYVAVVAILLTYSRSGALLAALGSAVWVALAPRRLPALVALAIGGGVGAAVAGFGFTLAGIADDGQAESVRVDHGALLGVALVVGAVLVVVAAELAARYEGRVSPALERYLVRRILLAASVGAAIVLIGLVVRAGGPVAWIEARAAEFRNPPTLQVTEDPERLGSTSSNNRWTWWKEAARSFADDPLVGTGAGSFQVSHRRLRESSLEVREPHSLPLQLLSETGLVGFLLAAGATGAAALAMRRALGRLGEEDRLAGRALALAAALYLLQALVDIDWDFVAVSAPVFVALGVLLGAGAPRPAALAPRREPLWAVGVAVLAACCLYSLAAPWLAHRRVEEAYAELDEGLELRGTAYDAKVARAADLGREARRLNPVSIEPVLVAAVAEETLGRHREALRLYREATEVQPENRSAWYELARYELLILGRAHDAYAHFNRMYELDRYGPGGDLLVAARCRFDPTDCPPELLER